MSKLNTIRDSPRIKRWSLFHALTLASALSSLIAIIVGLSGGKALVDKYVRDVIRGQQATIVAFFKDSISQQILVGDGPEILRKCHMLLKEEYARAVLVRDLDGETLCDLFSGERDDPVRWVVAAVYFDENQSEVASEIKIGFSTAPEQQLLLVVSMAAFIGTGLLFMIQILFLVPLTKRIVSPITSIAQAVSTGDPEDIRLPEAEMPRIQIKEVQSIVHALTAFLRRFDEYKFKLVESTRFEAVARTVQIIAHDLKAPMAAFERIIRVPEEHFAQEKRHLIAALRQLYSMTDAIKRAEFDDVVRLKAGLLKLGDILQYSSALADKHGVTLLYEGPRELQLLAADEAQLVRALSNLLVNALEAARTEVRMELECRGSMFAFRIMDDGPGVPALIQDKLFARGATAGKEQGTGLGLYYVQRVALGHGGEVRYERLEERTIFSLELPIEAVKISESHPQVMNMELAPGPIEPAKEASKSILIVVLSQERKAELESRLKRDDIAIELPETAGGTYEIVLSEEWNLGSEVRVLRQKILLDPAERSDKCVSLVLRFLASHPSPQTVT